jgi:hypothetical protein
MRGHYKILQLPKPFYYLGVLASYWAGLRNRRSKVYTFTLIFMSGAAWRRTKLFTASEGALDKKFAGSSKFVVTPLGVGPFCCSPTPVE